MDGHGWTDGYQETSILANASLLATETDEQARERRSGNLKKASARAAISLAATGAAVGIGVATAGVGIAPSIAIGSVSGGVAGGTTTAATEAVTYGIIDKGDVAGAVLMGAAVGAATGGIGNKVRLDRSVHAPHTVSASSLLPNAPDDEQPASDRSGEDEQNERLSAGLSKAAHTIDAAASATARRRLALAHRVAERRTVPSALETCLRRSVRCM